MIARAINRYCDIVWSWIDKYKIRFSGRQERELSTSRTFITLKTSVYKGARQSGQQSVRIQSDLCEVACNTDLTNKLNEVACEQNGRD